MSCDLANRKQAWGFVRLSDHANVEQIGNDPNSVGYFLRPHVTDFGRFAPFVGLCLAAEEDWLRLPAERVQGTIDLDQHRLR